MKTFEAIINSTCTSIVRVEAESVEQARSKVIAELADQGCDSNPEWLSDCFESYYKVEPSEQWTVKEAGE